MMKVPEQYRVKSGKFGSNESYGCNGYFLLPSDPERGLRQMHAIASDEPLEDDGEAWEHVSAKVAVGPFTYTPTWEEMCRVKDLFWDEEDAVMQLHPRKSQMVNYHPNVLHLWRPVLDEASDVFPIPEPPMSMVGPQKSHLKRKGL